MERVAAIDAGSNGIRLIIADTDDAGGLSTVYKIREAVRLGADAFGSGRFRPETIDRAVKAFKGFREKLDEYCVDDVRAVATSAAREAENGSELVDAVAGATGIEIELIDGLEEARLIFRAVDASVDLRRKLALLVDMGGGSVELTFARNRIPLGCETMPLGPVRLLERMRAKDLSEKDVPKLLARRRGAVRSMIDAELEAEDARIDVCVGTGGNLVRIAELGPALLGRGSNRFIEPSSLDEIIERLLEMSYKMRMEDLGMRADRADIVVIAAMILRMIVCETRVQRIHVPDVGLKEGLLLSLINSRPRVPLRPQ